ncbi:hypothetical protein ADICYQ_2742 [Cyclobacterium qasimii M12-11B]|uniref:Uncharacterized protein n=1 Tax=Cyclobacterium qasimii M12-11B TaxID=641524 RepID=S7VFG3_9BACT|nr:hypothetical protein ADICYQ_2742 [Cyclobacterium qasimii M12-11B]
MLIYISIAALFFYSFKRLIETIALLLMDEVIYSWYLPS